MHIDKAVALLKALEPAGDAVGIERGAVIADKHVRRVLPAVAHRIAQLLVPRLIRTQHLHRLQRQLHIARGAGFGAILIDARFCHVQQIVANTNLVVVPIDIVPMQAHNLAAAVACDDEHMRDSAPADVFCVQHQ